MENLEHRTNLYLPASTNNPYNLEQLIFNEKQPATYESRFRAEKMRYIRQVSPRLTYKKVSRPTLFFLHSFFGLSCQGSLIKPAHCGGTKEKKGLEDGGRALIFDGGGGIEEPCPKFPRVALTNEVERGEECSNTGSVCTVLYTTVVGRSRVFPSPTFSFSY